MQRSSTLVEQVPPAVIKTIQGNTLRHENLKYTTENVSLAKVFSFTLFAHLVNMYTQDCRGEDKVSHAHGSSYNQSQSSFRDRKMG